MQSFGSSICRHTFSYFYMTFTAISPSLLKVLYVTYAKPCNLQPPLVAFQALHFFLPHSKNYSPPIEMSFFCTTTTTHLLLLLIAPLILEIFIKYHTICSTMPTQNLDEASKNILLVLYKYIDQLLYIGFTTIPVV